MKQQTHEQIYIEDCNIHCAWFKILIPLAKMFECKKMQSSDHLKNILDFGKIFISSWWYQCIEHAQQVSLGLER